MSELDDIREAINALNARLDSLEDRLGQVQHLAIAAERMLNVASHLEQANHVLGGLEPRFTALERTFGELERNLDDLHKMSEEVWDRAAISRRLAALEDMLLRHDPGSDQTTTR